MREVIAKARFVSSKIRYWIDYLFPREVLGPFAIVFSFENVVNILFEQYYTGSPLVGWLVLGTLLSVAVSYWGIVDEDKDDVQKKIDEREKEIEEETGVDV